MRIGVLGGGQLGLMLAQAGAPLGHTFRFLDPSTDACAQREGELVVGAFDDDAALDRFADGLDVATYEFENVPVACVERLARRLPVRPGAESLRVAQDRLEEKAAFEAIGLETTRFLGVDSPESLARAIDALGLPAVLKARRGGYDGRSQVVVQDPREAPDAWRLIGGAPSILEAFAPFSRELSLVGVRSVQGETEFFPLVENHHEGGILRATIAPAPGISPDLDAHARAAVAALMERLDHVGVLTVEFFEVGGRLLANEFAPRVHNSGHWTIEGCDASQFAAHVMAVVGDDVQLGAVRPATMVNLIGAAPSEEELGAIPNVSVHLYGKSARPGRKIGHCTIASGGDDDRLAARARLEAMLAHWTDDSSSSP